MASGSKLNKALEVILNDLNDIKCSDANIEAIEAENVQLHEKKIELMGKLNSHSTISSALVIVKDMLSRQKALNQARTDLKKQAAIRSSDRLRDADAQAISWKQKLQEINNLMTLPHNEVLQKVAEMEEKIAANRTKIIELIQEHVKFKQNYQQEDEDILNLNEVLDGIEEDQRKLLEEFEKKNRIKGGNVQLQPHEEA